MMNMILYLSQIYPKKYDQIKKMVFEFEYRFSYFEDWFRFERYVMDERNLFLSLF